MNILKNQPASGLDAAVAAFYGYRVVSILDHPPTPDNPTKREMRIEKAHAIVSGGPVVSGPIEVVVSGSAAEMLEYFHLDSIKALRDALGVFIAEQGVRS